MAETAEFTKQLTEKGISEKEIEVVLNRLNGIKNGDESDIYYAMTSRYDPNGIWPDTKAFIEKVLNLNVPRTGKVETELPGPNRPVSDFVSEIADFYSTEEKLFYRINTDEIVRIGPVDLDKKGMQVQYFLNECLRIRPYPVRIISTCHCIVYVGFIPIFYSI